jgi:DNA mismatch repair protein MutS2
MALAEKYRNEAEFLKSSYEKTRMELEKKRLHMLDDAKRDAYEIVEIARDEINAILDKAGGLSATKDKIELKGKLNELQKSYAQGIRPDENADGPGNVKGLFDGTYRQGDIVYVKKLNSKATVLTDEEYNGEVTVSVGQMKIKLNTADIKFVDKNDNMHQNITVKDFKSKTIDISTQIDLRGENVDDSIAKLDKYLDDAHLAGLLQITVIHGKGTGVLRSGVHDFLKKHHHVKSFRSGQFGEGESGVTIVSLK